MIVVSDTSPLNYLVLLGIIDVLPKIYETVIVPPEVMRELTDNDTPDPVKEWASNPPDWLEIRQNTGLIIDKYLDPGESAAIALAIELKPDYIAIDELYGRGIAIQHKLEIVGTVGIIERAHRKGLLDLKTTLDALLQTSFRISQKLIDDVLARNP